MHWFSSSLKYASGKLFPRFITCVSNGLRNKMKTFFLKCLTVLEAWGFAADSPEGKWMRSFSSALAFSKLPFSCPSGRKWGVSYYEVEKSRRTRADSAEKHLRIFFFLSYSSIPNTVFVFYFLETSLLTESRIHKNSGVLLLLFVPREETAFILQT